MTILHRRIPVLPKRPIAASIARRISRSYPVGKKNISRACKGKVMTLTITADEKLPENIRANIITTMYSKDGTSWEKIPFMQEDEWTLVCKLKPKYAGLRTFRAEFSVDDGKSWFRDAVSDAWVLVDPRQVDGLRLYTLIPNISGTISDWKTDLTRIKALGFNAIHLLPITTQDTSQSPYSAKDLFQIDPSYLDKKTTLTSWEQLDEFVEEARRLHIRICFDLVLNHIGVDSTMSQRAPDWIMPDSQKENGMRRAGYWCENGWQFWEDLVLINYEHPSRAIRSEIWTYMIEYALFWAKYANYTEGFVRFDNLHSSNPDFVEELTGKLNVKYPNVGIIAEYFTDENTLLHTGMRWGLNLNLATPWDYKFVPQLREYLKNIHRISTHVRYYMPVTSHDSGVPAQEFGSAEATIPRYVAASLLGTGATGIVQGVEYGEKQKINFIGVQPKREFPAQAVFGNFLAKVNAILAAYPTFRRGGNCLFVDKGHDAILAAFRKSTGKNLYGFLVVCNFDIGAEQRIQIDLASNICSDGTVSYYDLLSDRAGVFPVSQIELLLAPSSAQVIMLTPAKSLLKIYQE